jgi:ribosomal-protein-alanine N-acetyltransferase
MMPAQVTLRQGGLSDLDAILALDRASDSAPHWPVSAYASILAPSAESIQQRYLVVAESPASENSTPHPAPLAGFAVALLHRVPPHITAELEDVIVAPDLRRKGIGRALCESAIHWVRAQSATEIALEVRAASTGAIALYSALGFRQSGRRPHYYRDPDDDAILMHLA